MSDDTLLRIADRVDYIDTENSTDQVYKQAVVQYIRELSAHGYRVVHENELTKLRRQAEIPLRIRDEEVWYWQGDGEDFPESLNCPVVMHADTLRALLIEADTARPQASGHPCFYCTGSGFVLVNGCGAEGCKGAESA